MLHAPFAPAAGVAGGAESLVCEDQHGIPPLLDPAKNTPYAGRLAATALVARQGETWS